MRVHTNSHKRYSADDIHTHLYADSQTMENKKAHENKKIWSMKGRILGEYLDPHQMNTLVKVGVNL